MSVWQWLAIGAASSFLGVTLASLERRVRYLERRERMLTRRHERTDAPHT